MDRAFVVSDTEAVSYISDKSSEEGNDTCGLEVGIVEHTEGRTIH